TYVMVGSDSKLRVVTHDQDFGVSLSKEHEFTLPTASSWSPPVFKGRDVYVGSTGGRVSHIEFKQGKPTPPLNFWSGEMVYRATSSLVSTNLGIGPLVVDDDGLIGFSNATGASSFIRFLSPDLSVAWNTYSPHSGSPSALVM